MKIANALLFLKTEWAKLNSQNLELGQEIFDFIEKMLK